MRSPSMPNFLRVKSSSGTDYLGGCFRGRVTFHFREHWVPVYFRKSSGCCWNNSTQNSYASCPQSKVYKVLEKINYEVNIELLVEKNAVIKVKHGMIKL